MAGRKQTSATESNQKTGEGLTRGGVELGKSCLASPQKTLRLRSSGRLLSCDHSATASPGSPVVMQSRARWQPGRDAAPRQLQPAASHDRPHEHQSLCRLVQAVGGVAGVVGEGEDAGDEAVEAVH